MKRKISSLNSFIWFDRLTTNGVNKSLVPFVLSLSKYTNTLLLFIFIFTNATSSFETGLKYQKNEQFTDAIACYEEIIQQDPRDINALFNLGYCYLALGQYNKSITAYDNALAISPQIPTVLYNKGFTYKTAGDIDTAIALYKQVLAINPDYEPAQLGLGFAYITQGNFDLGWQQHERYLKQSGKNGDRLRKLLATDTIAHKKVLLRPEGGLGDTLHFIRYAECLKDLQADVIVACQKQLVPILSRCTYIDHLVPCGSPAPEHDADATLMSLPAIFNDDETTAPNTIPYLFADPALVAYWKEQLASDTNFKVGICWQADLHNDIPSKLPIARRGIPLNNFAPLATIKGISFYSLQKYDGVEQLDSANFPLYVFDDLDENAGPFMDTAAIIKNLDLIITVDTAITHLAGGLGAKVWLLQPYATADWRWICHRTDSYWYPSMRIFKQQKPFDYDGVIEQVRIALQELINHQ